MMWRRAYRCGDLFAKRRQTMQAWADDVSKEPISSAISTQRIPSGVDELQVEAGMVNSTESKGVLP